MKILIYGYGRIGRTFKKILSSNYVKVYSRDPGKSEVHRRDIKRFDVVILCIPEKAYEDVIENLGKNQLVVDVSSIKENVLPLLRKKCKKYLSIHPLFGENVYPYFSEVVHVESNCPDAAEFLDVLKKAGLKVISLDDHDAEMAKIQGVPHFVLLALYEYLKNTKSRTALLAALLTLSRRVKSQNAVVMRKIQESSEDERRKFIRFLREFEKNMMDDFEKYFDVKEDLSPALNIVKIFEKPRTIEEYRNYFEVIDNLIADLLKIRNEKARELAVLKKQKNVPIEVRDVEERKLNSILKDSEYPVLLERIFTSIFQMSKAAQYDALKMNKLVGVLGPAGSYSEEAALKLGAGKTILKYYPTIEDVFSAVYNNEIKLGVVPIENNLTGSVMESIECLMKYDVFVIGETKLKIAHCLVAKNQNVALKDVRYVYSHPQAVMQCMNFIRRYLPRAEIVYSASTSQALNMLDDVSVAISSETAARMMNCAVLKRNIQDNKENTTRFYVISKEDSAIKRRITSIFFSVKDRPGALKEVLEVFSSKGINLRKLESRPDKFRPGKYVFFTEAEADVDSEVVKELDRKTEFLKIVGRFDEIDELQV